MIEDAEEKGLISPGVTTLVESTSGNLGIGLMYIALQKGYKFIAVTFAKLSLDKQILLKYLGAEVSLTGMKVICILCYLNFVHVSTFLFD